ncbi:MAG TPA: ABC transporter ATP-binding protein, partial [Polyangia bacterium]|nr:ABC transporter ATP-binding protein [Polyangia bacterium]
QEERVAEALELARAGDFARRSVRLLSGGERQRIALARALAIRPRGLLLDEPFGALDAELRRELRGELRDLVRRLGVTTVLITHDAEDVSALASRVIVLRAGRVEQAGTLPECYHRPASAYVATLLGEAALLPVTERQGERARLRGAMGGTEGAWVAVVGEGARVVVRPEQLVLVAEAEGDLSGQLVDIRFVAGRWRVTVELAGGGRVVALMERPPADHRVGLRIVSAEPLAVVP